MIKNETVPTIISIMNEQNQGRETRKNTLVELEKTLKRPIISFFTSFRFPVMIEDADADILEGILQKTDLSNGLAVVVSSPGGSGIAAERIINIFRNYSGTGEYWAIVPSKAKSAATMICFGASKIIMGGTSELGPIDPQIAVSENGVTKRFSLCNLVDSYDDLFQRAVREKNNLQPYLQQLANYDEREIKEFRTAISLSEDIATRTLNSGTMKGMPDKEIKKKIEVFLTPKKTKSHGRPIYAKEALSCGLNIELTDKKEKLYELFCELYIRTNNLVSTRASKCIENSQYSFTSQGPRKTGDKK